MMFLGVSSVVRMTTKWGKDKFRPGGGGVLPIMTCTGRLRPKGYLFHASGI